MNNFEVSFHKSSVDSFGIFSTMIENTVFKNDDGKTLKVNFYNQATSGKKVGHWMRVKLDNRGGHTIDYIVDGVKDGKISMHLNKDGNLSKSDIRYARDNAADVGAITYYGYDDIKAAFNGRIDSNDKLEKLGDKYDKLSDEKKDKLKERVIYND